MRLSRIEAEALLDSLITRDQYRVHRKVASVKQGTHYLGLLLDYMSRPVRQSHCRKVRHIALFKEAGNARMP